jgi:hypothetical protein
MLASLVAPVAFPTVAEYPIALALLAVSLALGTDHGARLAAALRTPRAWIAPAIATAVAIAAEASLHRAPWPMSIVWLGAPAAMLVASLVLWRVQGLFAGVCCVVGVVAATGLHAEGTLLAAERDFFGVLRVRQSGALRTMTHGSTLHGVQRTAPPSPTPGTYYHPDTPMGAAVAHASDHARIAIVGLGTGSLAALTRPGQSLTFHELDPAVEPMARRWFTFLRDARGDVNVVDGDARLTLARAPRAAHELLIIDAFTSDAIPVHLLTVEAVAMYMQRLSADGVVLVHVSNRYLDLVRVLAGAASTLGLALAVNNYVPSDALERDGVRACTVVALARDRSSLAHLAGRGWTEARVARPVVWTDDRSSLIDVLAR